MKIVLTNKTAYRDDDLRAIIRGACQAAGVRLSALHVSITRAKGNAVSGYAYYPTATKRSLQVVNHMRLRIPAPGVTIDHGSVAQVALHEALHLNGARHADMTEEQLNCTMATPWAEELPLRTKEAPPRQDPELRRAAARVDRLEHAQKMLTKAQTRLKRAATIEKKWKRRVGALSR